VEKIDNSNRYSHVGRFLINWGIVFSIAVAFIIFSLTAPKAFFSWSNIITILRSISITTVIAMGATFGFSIGVFDMSFASVATLAAAFSVTFVAWYGIPFPLAIAATFLACSVVGIINSIVSIRLKVPAFLATLAMQFILEGFVLTYSGGSLINPKITSSGGQKIVATLPDMFWNLGKAPYIVIIMFACIIVVEIFQVQTKHGRMIYMVGANPEAAALSGVKVNHYKVFSFVITTVFSVIAGILIVSRAGTVQSNAGVSFLMPTIASVNIGQSLAGRGKPNALGTFVGAALIGVVENGLYALSFPYYSINIVKGVILLLALIISYYSNKDSH
jgi:simple sugar transport system permease protein